MCCRGVYIVPTVLSVSALVLLLLLSLDLVEELLLFVEALVGARRLSGHDYRDGKKGWLGWVCLVRRQEASWWRMGGPGQGLYCIMPCYSTMAGLFLASGS